MKTIGDLPGSRRTHLRTLRINATTVSANHTNSRLLLQPRLEALGRAVCQQVPHGTLLQIDQDRAVGLPFTPSPIIDTEDLYRVDGSGKLHQNRGLHTPQHRVITDANGQAAQEPRTR